MEELKQKDPKILNFKSRILNLELEIEMAIDEANHPLELKKNDENKRLAIEIAEYLNLPVVNNATISVRIRDNEDPDHHDIVLTLGDNNYVINDNAHFIDPETNHEIPSEELSQYYGPAA